MLTYISSVKYTTEGLARATQVGFVKYRTLVEKAWESVGGKMLSCHLGNTAGEWDVVAIGEVPSRDAAFALANATRLSGGVARSSIQELFTAEEADAALAGSDAKSPANLQGS